MLEEIPRSPQATCFYLEMLGEINLRNLPKWLFMNFASMVLVEISSI